MIPAATSSIEAFELALPNVEAVASRGSPGREYQSALRCFNQRLAVLRQCLGMKSALSTYAARHTWATMAYHCEIHPGIISEAMGPVSYTHLHG